MRDDGEKILSSTKHATWAGVTNSLLGNRHVLSGLLAWAVREVEDEIERLGLVGIEVDEPTISVTYRARGWLPGTRPERDIAPDNTEA